MGFGRVAIDRSIDRTVDDGLYRRRKRVCALAAKTEKKSTEEPNVGENHI